MPDGGKRTPLALSYSWGQTALETQFASTFQPGHGIFSPGTPLVPPEPEKTRLWDFPIGVNTTLTPRAYEPVSFTELRALAEAHDITRLAIETRKDQIEKLDWAIKSRDARRPAGSGAVAPPRLPDQRQYDRDAARLRARLVRRASRLGRRARYHAACDRDSQGPARKARLGHQTKRRQTQRPAPAERGRARPC